MLITNEIVLFNWNNIHNITTGSDVDGPPDQYRLDLQVNGLKLEMFVSIERPVITYSLSVTHMGHLHYIR